MDGFVNVDSEAACEPDLVWDLEQTPWPWEDDSASEVWLIHALEHMGRDPAVFLAIMKELYRVLEPGGKAVIHVPHPRSDDFVSDPTHVRPVTPSTLRMFDRRLNEHLQADGFSNTPLALYTGVDLVLAETRTIIDQEVLDELQAGRITEAEVRQMIKRQNNVATEFRFVLQARKPHWTATQA